MKTNNSSQTDPRFFTSVVPKHIDSFNHSDLQYATERNFAKEKDTDDKKEAPDSQEGLMMKMMKTRSILLSGEVNKELAERVIRSLLLLEEAGKDPIKVYIDSPGGDVDAGYAIFDMIRFIDAPVYTIGMGLVASAGALILLSAPKERRIGLPNSHYLIHQPLSGIRGVATEIEIHAKELEKLQSKLNKLISDETGKPIDQVSKDTDRDFWMSAQEALAYGLVSKVITKRSEIDWK
jgi:ATP-dependent Clp protease protease subunit